MPIAKRIEAGLRVAYSRAASTICARGTPVAAYPVTGPIDVVGKSDVDVLDDDLQKSTLRALEISPERCRAHAEKYSWEESARQFLGNLAPKESSTRELTPTCLRRSLKPPPIAEASVGKE